MDLIRIEALEYNGVKEEKEDDADRVELTSLRLAEKP